MRTIVRLIADGFADMGDAMLSMGDVLCGKPPRMPRSAEAALAEDWRKVGGDIRRARQKMDAMLDPNQNAVRVAREATEKE